MGASPHGLSLQVAKVLSRIDLPRTHLPSRRGYPTSSSFVKVAGGAVEDGSEQLILARIQYGDGGSGNSGADANETVTLWVNPVDESSEPVIDQDSSTDFLNRGGGRVTSISMRGQNMYGYPAFFDSLRVGTTFASVVPEPATGILLALGFFALAPFVLRRR